MCAEAYDTLPSGFSICLRRAFPGTVFLRAVATCFRCLALGSYMAVLLALETLLQSALPLVSLGRAHLALPDQILVDDPVGVFWLRELDDY